VSQQQENLTDSLISVIQAIQTGRGTGELRAQRDDGSSMEIGSILFINGQIVAAQIGSYNGMVAFNMLKTWGRCVFIFIQNPPPQPSPQNRPSGRTPLFETSPSITGPQASVTGARPPVTGARPMGARPVTGSQTSVTGPHSPITGPQPSITGSQSSITGPQTPLPAQPRVQHPDAGLLLTSIPRATMSILKARGIIEQAGLSRIHRQLILLIDGQRSVSELTIAIGCPPQDMRQMLQELEALSVIRIPRM